MSNTKKGEYAKQNRSYQDKMVPGSDESFFEKTYDAMLKKAGKKKGDGSFNAHAESKKITKNRPEYSGIFRSRSI